MKEMCLAVQKWLNERYGKMEGQKIWEVTCKQYNHYLKEFPDYGGKKNAQALAIYGSIIIYLFIHYYQINHQLKNFKILSHIYLLKN